MKHLGVNLAVSGRMAQNRIAFKDDDVQANSRQGHATKTEIAIVGVLPNQMSQ